MAARTRSRVSSDTIGCPLETRETVWEETPARRATSAMEASLRGGLTMARPCSCTRPPPSSYEPFTVRGVLFRPRGVLAPRGFLGDDPVGRLPVAASRRVRTAWDQGVGSPAFVPLPVGRRRHEGPDAAMCPTRRHGSWGTNP